MAKPLVAIVGRPNVGKSMLFNKLCGQRLSIVQDTPGVTRDRIYAECEWRNRSFDIVGAKNCGVESVGVYYGFAEPGELENAGANHIADTVAELEQILMQLL